MTNNPAEKAMPLRECPFCGSADIDPEGVASFKKEFRTKAYSHLRWDKDATPDKIEHHPACNNCSATTEGDWNTRAAPGGMEKVNEAIAILEQALTPVKNQSQSKGAMRRFGAILDALKCLQDADLLPAPAVRGMRERAVKLCDAIVETTFRSFLGKVIDYTKAHPEFPANQEYVDIKIEGEEAQKMLALVLDAFSENAIAAAGNRLTAGLEEIEGVKVIPTHEIIYCTDIPPGFVLVPEEPTEEMLEAAFHITELPLKKLPPGIKSGKDLRRAIYKAMITAHEREKNAKG